MSAERLINKLIRILETERNLINCYNRDCEVLHRHVVSKNWPDLEKTLLLLKERAESLSIADNEREMIISVLKKEMALPEESSFGLLLSRFPESSSRRINDLKRDIRRSILILQGRIKGIGQFTEGRTSALKEVLDVLVPDRKGRIYDRNGAASAIGSKPMLFSKHF